MNAALRNVNLRRDLAKALRMHRYERTPTGLYFPQARMHVGGVFEHWVNDGAHAIDPNIVVNEGLNYLLDAALSAATPLTAWYIAPFAADVTPGASLTAATFTATTTEFTNYDE